MRSSLVTILIITLLAGCTVPSSSGYMDFSFNFCDHSGTYRVTIALPVQHDDIVVTSNTQGVRAFAFGWQEYKGLSLRDYDILAYTPKVAQPPITRLFFPVGTGTEEYRISKTGEVHLKDELWGVTIRGKDDFSRYRTSLSVRFIEIVCKEITSDEAKQLALCFPNARYVSLCENQTPRVVAQLLTSLKIEFVGWCFDDKDWMPQWRHYGYNDDPHSATLRYAQDLLSELDEPTSLKFLDLPGRILKFTLQRKTSYLFPQLEGIVFRGFRIDQNDFDKYLSSLNDLRILQTLDIRDGVTMLPEHIFDCTSMEHFSGNFEHGIAEMRKRAFVSPVSWKLLSYRGGIAKPGFFGDKTSVVRLEAYANIDDDLEPMWHLDEYPNLRYLRVRQLASFNYGDLLPANLQYLVIDEWMHQKKTVIASLKQLKELRCNTLDFKCWDATDKTVSRLKLLTTDDLEAAVILQPLNGYDYAELRSPFYLQPDERVKNLRFLHALKSREIFIPYLYMPKEDRRLFDDISNLHLIRYDSEESRIGFKDIVPPSKHIFGDPEWVLRHVTKVERAW